MGYSAVSHIVFFFFFNKKGEGDYRPLYEAGIPHQIPLGLQRRHCGSEESQFGSLVGLFPGPAPR